MRYRASPASPLQCLLVEDQALIGMALEAYLEDAGYECRRGSDLGVIMAQTPGDAAV